MNIHAVAPHAGAWIETPHVCPSGTGHIVAPHAGAWIETHDMDNKQTNRKKSRPVRARGLKPSEADSIPCLRLVAPRAGAWIETNYSGHVVYGMVGRAPCGRVD